MKRWFLTNISVVFIFWRLFQHLSALACSMGTDNNECAWSNKKFFKLFLVIPHTSLDSSSIESISVGSSWKASKDIWGHNVIYFIYRYNSKVVEPVRYIKHCKSQRKYNSWYFVYSNCPAAPSIRKIISWM